MSLSERVWQDNIVSRSQTLYTKPDTVTKPIGSRKGGTIQGFRVQFRVWSMLGTLNYSGENPPTLIIQGRVDHFYVSRLRGSRLNRLLDLQESCSWPHQHLVIDDYLPRHTWPSASLLMIDCLVNYPHHNLVIEGCKQVSMLDAIRWDNVIGRIWGTQCLVATASILTFHASSGRKTRCKASLIWYRNRNWPAVCLLLVREWLDIFRFDASEDAVPQCNLANTTIRASSGRKNMLRWLPDL
jgi:hypothetical protein